MSVKERIISRSVVQETPAQIKSWQQLERETQVEWAADMPLPEVPILREISEEIRMVSEHETQHVLIGVRRGYNPLYVTTRPMGDALGVTAFANLGVVDHQVIAASGPIATPSGVASGYGHDLMQVRRAQIYHNGIGEGEAISRASGHLANFSHLFKYKFAEIIGYMGYVGGNRIGEVIKRVNWEIDNLKTAPERVAGEYGLLEVFEKNQELAKARRDGEILRLELLEGGLERQIREKNGVVVEAHILCIACGGIDGHKIDCLQKHP